MVENRNEMVEKMQSNQIFQSLIVNIVLKNRLLLKLLTKSETWDWSTSIPTPYEKLEKDVSSLTPMAASIYRDPILIKVDQAASLSRAVVSGRYSMNIV